MNVPVGIIGGVAIALTIESVRWTVTTGEWVSPVAIVRTVIGEIRYRRANRRDS